MNALPLVTDFVRTDESAFAHIPDFPYPPHYTEVGGLRIACIDEGPRDAPVVLLMHGEPTWSFLYRKMIPVLLQAGFRVVAPDLVGFGRSDKPIRKGDYSYRHHVQWMSAWLQANDLTSITLFCQDWGSLIGLRMAAAAPERFDRIVLANGGLPTGTTPVPKAFKIWRAFAQYSPWFPIGRIVKAGCTGWLTPAEVAAYDAPFPDRGHRAALRAFPALVPEHPDDDGAAVSREAARFWREQWQGSSLMVIGQADPVLGEPVMRQLHQCIRNCPPPVVLPQAGHFVQEHGAPVAQQALSHFQFSVPTS